MAQRMARHYRRDVRGVSIVTFHSHLAPLVATVEAVCGQTPPPDLLMVHANAADDPELEAIRSALVPHADGIELAVTGSSVNAGFSGAHNANLRSAFDRGCDGVLVLNPDLVLEPDAMVELASAEADCPDPALFGPLLELADPDSLAGSGRIDTAGIVWIFGGRHIDSLQDEPLTHAPAVTTEVAGISGACLYVGRRAFVAVTAVSGEFFDEDFIAYREDAELAYRAQIIGVRSYLVPGARGRHVRGLRGTTRGHDPEIDRLGVRNRFLIAFKYGAERPGGLLAAGLRDVVVVCGVFTTERGSIAGLREAWALRRRMRDKGRALRAMSRRVE